MSEWVYVTGGTPVSDTDGEISLPRERIIRCCDCRYYASNMHECMRLDEWDDSLWFTVEQDDFCSCGKKVEG